MGSASCTVSISLVFLSINRQLNSQENTNLSRPASQNSLNCKINHALFKGQNGASDIINLYVFKLMFHPLQLVQIFNTI